ncbi:dTMP kinase [Patescibacteria group bacterium]|nr:dTMP kinase [Patescibacteria group bacterium]MCL5091603.1 dTMP kinase [Patescibacteria group bacterium]
MFIVIEGIDGAGCETQAKAVSRALTDRSGQPTVSLIKYPHYDDAVGKMIQQFLYQNKSLTAKEQFLLYSLQFINDIPKINRYTAANAHPPTNSYLVADRYFTSTICYQTLEGIPEEIALRFADDFGIIKPDLVFYLDVDPDTALSWKYGEDKRLNFRETDLAFMKKTYNQYDRLVKRQVWTKWVRINGKQTKENVTREILNKINQPQ